MQVIPPIIYNDSNCNDSLLLKILNINNPIKLENSLSSQSPNLVIYGFFSVYDPDIGVIRKKIRIILYHIPN